MTLSERLQSIRTNAFLRSVGVLAGGSALAYGVTALGLPIVTRLYTPDQFGVLAVFNGVLLTVSVAACLRFDIAVSIPDDDVDAANLLALAALSAAVVACCLGVGLVVACDECVSAESLPATSLLLPFGVFVASIYSALQFWFVRRKRFKPIAVTRIYQTAAGTGTQIGFGWAGFGPIGLVLGQVLTNGAGAVGLGWRILAEDRALLRRISLARMRVLFGSYSRFPKYSTLEALCNSAAAQLPIVMIAALEGTEGGFLMLAVYVMQAPVSLIGTATMQVYLSRGPDEHRAGRLGDFTTQVFAGLFSSGVGPLVFAGIIAPDAFALLFGESWSRAGILVSWMIPWLVVQLLVSPISTALHITGHTRTALILQVLGLAGRVSAVYAAALWFSSWISEAYAISGLAFYLAYLIVVLRVAGTARNRVVARVRAGLPAVVVWTLAGILLLVLYRAF